MRKYLYISYVLVFLSCHEEVINEYSYDEYMSDGWEAFEYKNWPYGKELFNTGIDQASQNQNIAEAHSGLGWIYLYEANELSPISSNDNLRNALRDSAGMEFEKGQLQGSSNIDLSVWTDVLSGFSYDAVYKSDKFLSEYYNLTFYDPSKLDSMVVYSDLALAKTDTLLSLNPNYVFRYDECLNKNYIRILRAQIYFNLQENTKMFDELNLLTDEYECNSYVNNMPNAIECIALAFSNQCSKLTNP